MTRATASQSARLARYRGTSLMRNNRPAGPYSSPMPRTYGGSEEGWVFLMSEVPL